MAHRRVVTPGIEARQKATEDLLRQLQHASCPEQRASLLDDVVALNLTIADALVNRYTGRGVDRDDLVQVARIALFKAARRYRPGDGSCFGAYAVPTITGELKRCLRDQAWMIRPPRRLQELYLSAGATRGELEQRLGRPIQLDDLGAELGTATEGVREAEDAGHTCYRAASLDEGPDVVAGHHGSWLAVLDHSLEGAADVITLRRAIRSLAARDRRVIRMRYVEDLTQAEIAAVIGVSQMQVSRILKRVLGHLRTELDEAC